MDDTPCNPLAHGGAYAGGENTQKSLRLFKRGLVESQLARVILQHR
jgi:hypothetical protein